MRLVKFSNLDISECLGLLGFPSQRDSTLWEAGDDEYLLLYQLVALARGNGQRHRPEAPARGASQAAVRWLQSR